MEAVTRCAHVFIRMTRQLASTIPNPVLQRKGDLLHQRESILTVENCDVKNKNAEILQEDLDAMGR